MVVQPVVAVRIGDVSLEVVAHGLNTNPVTPGIAHLVVEHEAIVRTGVECDPVSADSRDDVVP